MARPNRQFPMMTYLEFEKPVAALQEQIDDLRPFSAKDFVDALFE